MSESPHRRGHISWSTWIILLLNAGLVIALLLCYLAASVPPRTIGYVALFGLAYPFILIANCIFIIYWFFKKRRYALISFVAIALGFGYVTDVVQLNIFGKNRKGEHAIKVMTYNVRLFGLYSQEHPQAMKKKIFDLLDKQEADLLCFQEFYYTDKKGEFETRDTLTKFLPTKYYHERYTHSMNGRKYFGVALFSKYPIVKKGYIPFESDVNNFCIYADLLIDGDTVRLYNAHLASIRFQKEDYALISDNQNHEELDQGGKRIARRLRSGFIRREEQVQRILENVRTCKYPVILCGDFNDPPVSYCYSKLTGELQDSFIEVGNGVGNTYNGAFPSFRIDYVLHSDEFVALDYTTLSEEYSDHFPVVVTLAKKSAD